VIVTDRIHVRLSEKRRLWLVVGWTTTWETLASEPGVDPVVA
jgi:hypothetical protein